MMNITINKDYSDLNNVCIFKVDNNECIVNKKEHIGLLTELRGKRREVVTSLSIKFV